MTSPYYPRDLLPEGFRVARAANDLLFAEDGRQYIDLLSGAGSVFLGHANPEIVHRVQEQLAAVWSVGAVPTRIGVEALAAVDRLFAPSHRLAVLYSTGMEAAEFALRVARQITGRRGVVGFDGSMHGKSMATAGLGWPNELATLPDLHRLPYLPRCGEDVTLERLADVLSSDSISAVFVEPLLGSSGGYIPSHRFADRVSRLCADHGSLLVMDEILTGFHRTGPAFLYQELGVTPDIVLIGKAMGNGFPVSGVVVDCRHSIDRRMFPGSTFAGNPLAAAAVLATLRAMQSYDLPDAVSRIEDIVLSNLAGLRDSGIELRGKGALWILELPSAADIPGTMAQILRGGAIVSPTANFIRLLPAATISPTHLSAACIVIREACQEHSGSGR